MRLSFTAFLPIALTGMVMTSSVKADEACTVAYDDAISELILGESCVEVDGMCPDTCAELFAALDSACAGKSYTDADHGAEEEYNQAITVTVFQLVSITGACEDADLTPPAGEATTCTDAFTEASLEVLVGDSCTEVDGMCPDTCKELLTSLDSTCDGKSHDLDGEDTKYNSALTRATFSEFIDDACADEISGAILVPNASAALVMGSIALISSFHFL
jgi:hypothetical protein